MKKESDNHHFKFKAATLFILFFICRLPVNCSLAQSFTIDSLDEDGLVLNAQWKYKEGDNKLWANPAFNDAAWDTIGYMDHPVNKDNIHWYRLHIKMDSSLVNKPLAMIISQQGASEIYLNGVKLAEYGHVAANKRDEKGYNPHNKPFIFNFNSQGYQMLAIRYSNHLNIKASKNYAPILNIYPANDGIELSQETKTPLLFIHIAIGFFAGLTFLHLLLFLFYPADKNNLYYSIFTSTALLILIAYHILFNSSNSFAIYIVNYSFAILYILFFYVIFRLSSRLFGLKKKRYFYINAFLASVSLLLYIFKSSIFPYVFISLIFNSCITTIFMIRYAWKGKHDGVLILGSGILFAVIYVIIMMILVIFNGFNLEFSGTAAIIFFSFLLLAVLSVPISMSVYLARAFAVKSNTLTKKLQEVEELSILAVQQSKEKEEILFLQNEKLGILVNKRTEEVTLQKNELQQKKELLEIKSQEIYDSLQYARYLQEVILPPVAFIKEKLKDCFVLYKPKDIVAGDFYYAEQIDDTFFVAVADCTGHGVPGAMLSVLCSNALNQAVKEFKLSEPGKILDKVNELVAIAFEKSNREVYDGMDISLMVFHFENKKIEFAGANNNLWYFTNGVMTEVKADKQPIGKYQHKKLFTTNILEWVEGTVFYLFTDGYADQFGGEKGKKFMRKNLADLLHSIHQKPADEQSQLLDTTFKNWYGKNEQVDDVTIMGIMI